MTFCPESSKTSQPIVIEAETSTDCPESRAGVYIQLPLSSPLKRRILLSLPPGTNLLTKSQAYFMYRDRDPARSRLGAFHSEVAPPAAKTISISAEGSISSESSESPEGPSAMTPSAAGSATASPSAGAGDGSALVNTPLPVAGNSVRAIGGLAGMDILLPCFSVFMRPEEKPS